MIDRRTDRASSRRLTEGQIAFTHRLTEGQIAFTRKMTEGQIAFIRRLTEGSRETDNFQRQNLQSRSHQTTSKAKLRSQVTTRQLPRPNFTVRQQTVRQLPGPKFQFGQLTDRQHQGPEFPVGQHTPPRPTFKVGQQTSRTNTDFKSESLSHTTSKLTFLRENRPNERDKERSNS